MELIRRGFFSRSLRLRSSSSLPMQYSTELAVAVVEGEQVVANPAQFLGLIPRMAAELRWPPVPTLVSCLGGASRSAGSYLQGVEKTVPECLGLGIALERGWMAVTGLDHHVYFQEWSGHVIGHAFRTPEKLA